MKKFTCVFLLVILAYAAVTANAQTQPKFWIGGFEQNAALAVPAFDPRTSSTAQCALGVVDNPELGSATHELDNS